MEIEELGKDQRILKEASAEEVFDIYVMVRLELVERGMLQE